MRAATAKGMVMNPYDSFKAYDIRGELETQLTPDFAEQVGRAFTQYLGAKSVVVGGDIRLSTPELKAALPGAARPLGPRSSTSASAGRRKCTSPPAPSG